MATRKIIIGADENGEGGFEVHRGTSVKDSLETDTDTVTCFDEVVPQGAEKVGGTLEIEKLSYDSIDEYIELKNKLNDMLANPAMITTLETIKFKGEGAYIIKKNYINCILDTKDYEMNPEEHSVHSLKFIYGECKEEDPKEA